MKTTTKIPALKTARLGKTARIVKAATDAGFKVVHAPRPTPLIFDDLIPLPMDVQASILRSFSSV